MLREISRRNRRRQVISEALEGRVLLTGSAALSAQPVITQGNTIQSFTVVYTDSAGINSSSINRSNLTVTGPSGQSITGSYAFVASTTGNSASAVYNFNAPGGNFVPKSLFAISGNYVPYTSGAGSAATFTTADNGTYTVTLNSNSVTDNNGAAITGGVLGTFQVSIASQSVAEEQFTHTIIDSNPGTLPTTKALIDIYGNGYREPLLGRHDGSGLYFYEPQSWSNPTGPWVKYTIAASGDFYEDIQVADINGDGYEDIVASINNGNGYTMYWLENPLGYGGNPTQPWQQIEIGTGLGHNFTLGDLDNDGKLDVITQRAIYFQNSPTSWTQIDAPQLNLGEFDGGTAVDVLNNGITDVVGVADDGSHALTLFENPLNFGGNPRTGTWTEHEIGPGYNTTGDSLAAASGDFTGDGLNDIVTASGERESGEAYPPAPGGLILWLAPSQPLTQAWTPVTIDSSFTDVHKIDVADINGDGKLDIVAAEQEQSVNQRISIFYNVGQNGQSWQQQVLANTGNQNVRIGDITDNGLLDLFGSNHGFYNAPDPVEAWLQNGSAITSAPAAPSELFATASGTAGIALDWQDNSAIANGYQNPLNFIIQRSTDNQNFSQIAKLSLGTFTYLDTTANPNVKYYYRVAAANALANSGFSDTASANLGSVSSAAPTITTNPQSQTRAVGSDVTFTAAASGSPTPKVQWFESAGVGSPFSTISGATSTTLDIGSANLSENGTEYEAVFTNSLGTATTSPATLTVTAAATIAPTVTTNPTSQSVTVGTSVSFTAAASGTPTPTVQWELSTNAGVSFAPISGATSTTLSVGATTVSETGNEYKAIFTNTAGTATTSPATLTVTASSSGGSLNGSQTTPASRYNLSSIGTSDWAHWGRGGSYSNFDHDASGNSQISKVAVVGAGSNNGGWSDPSRSVNWTGGTPTVTDSGDDGYIWSNGALNTGYSFTVPADTSTRTLFVYAGGYGTGGQLTAHLSDGSAADYIANSSGSGIYTGYYTITYHAASAGQTLTITLEKTQNITGTQGSVDLIAAMLAMPTTAISPTVTTNPTSQSVTVGTPVSFTAAASGTPAPTVQWELSTSAGVSFAPISGATSTTLSIGATTVSETGNEYEAIFTNTAGTATTSPATLTVTAAVTIAPTVTTNPTSQSVIVGTPVSFTAAASGTPTPIVQWELSTDGVNFNPIAGATSTTLSIGATTVSETGNEYEAIFTNTAGTAATSPATLTVTAIAPTVTTNPSSQSVTAGTPVSFTAAASGTPTPTVQWELSTDGVNFNPIAGATSTTLSVGATTVSETGNEYEAIFTNTAGTATTSPATLTVTAAVTIAPTVTTNPTSQSVIVGTPVTFTAAASGTPTPTVQWELSTDGINFNPISGATSTTLSIGATTVSETGNEYEAIFTNTAGTATTSPATLTVTAIGPTVTTNPTSQSVTAGTPVTFTAAASGTPTPTVQWELSTNAGVSFAPISGATSTTLSIGAATVSETGNEYEAIFTNTAGTATTSPATLTVTQATTTTGSITGSEVTAASKYNLTTLGTTDWAHWGRGGNSANFDHSATGGSQISNVTKLGSGSYGGYTYGGRDAIWTNGTPTKSVTGDTGYIWANNAISAGYSFTVPASTTAHTLYVYLGGYSSGGTFTASLTDKSVPSYSVTLSGSSNYQGVVAINFKAASAGQTLTLSWVKSQTIGDASGSVDLIAAWLQ